MQNPLQALWEYVYRGRIRILCGMSKSISVLSYTLVNNIFSECAVKLGLANANREIAPKTRTKINEKIERFFNQYFIIKIPPIRYRHQDFVVHD